MAIQTEGSQGLTAEAKLQDSGLVDANIREGTLLGRLKEATCGGKREVLSQK